MNYTTFEFLKGNGDEIKNFLDLVKPYCNTIKIHSFQYVSQNRYEVSFCVAFIEFVFKGDASLKQYNEKRINLFEN